MLQHGKQVSMAPHLQVSIAPQITDFHISPSQHKGMAPFQLRLLYMVGHIFK